MTVASNWTPAALFSYMARFSNAAEWDPGVASATDISGAATMIGSEYQLMITLGRRAIPLTYKVIEFSEGRQVVLLAENFAVRSRDEIEVTPAPGGGSTLTYTAALSGRGPLALFEPLIARSFRRIGTRAEESLRAKVST